MSFIITMCSCTLIVSLRAPWIMLSACAAALHTFVNAKPAAAPKHAPIDGNHRHDTFQHAPMDDNRRVQNNKQKKTQNKRSGSA